MLDKKIADKCFNNIFTDGDLKDYAENLNYLTEDQLE